MTSGAREGIAAVVRVVVVVAEAMSYHADNSEASRPVISMK